MKEESGTEYRLYHHYPGMPGMDPIVKRTWKNVTAIEIKGATVTFRSGKGFDQPIVAMVRLAPGEFIEKYDSGV